jgi:hypothetical protein
VRRTGDGEGGNLVELDLGIIGLELILDSLREGGAG